MTIIVADSPDPEISLRVGAPGNTVSTVTFDVPAQQVGSGTRITDNTPIRISATATATPANSRTATLTADSSAGLMCITPVTCGTTSIPFSEIGWTSSEGTLPSGMFDGTAEQVLGSFQNSRTVSGHHTFYYLNSDILPRGSYRGRVIYTLSMP